MTTLKRHSHTLGQASVRRSGSAASRGAVGEDLRERV
jgi:hypothetical protein